MDNKIQEIGLKYFQCNCGEMYKSRNLSAPDCPHHSLEWEEACKEYASYQSQQPTGPAWVKAMEWCDKELKSIIYNNSSKIAFEEMKQFLQSIKSDESQSRQSAPIKEDAEILILAEIHVSKVKEACEQLGTKLNDSSAAGYQSGYFKGYKDRMLEVSAPIQKGLTDWKQKFEDWYLNSKEANEQTYMPYMHIEKWIEENIFKPVSVARFLISTEDDGGKVNFYWAANKKYIGYAYKEVDGYYVFQFDSPNGCISDHTLQAIADKLFALNKGWDEYLKDQKI